MLIAHSIDEFRRASAPDQRYAVTIGNFDGVHVGHRELVRVTREKGAAKSVPSLLVTFDPHPVFVVRGIAKPDLLTPLPRKLELLEQTGLDAVLVLPFTKSVADMSAESFVMDILVDLLHASDLVTGYNFALGKGRTGNYTALCGLGKRHGFDLTQVQPVIVERETVSSSLIREYIRSGDVSKATPLLARMHSVDGRIIHGQARGRTLGFPTANIDFGNTLLPPLGAYATWLHVFPNTPEVGLSTVKPLTSMTSVGTNPTFGGGTVTLETHALDFSGDLYGSRVRLYFLQRLRAEIKFKSVNDLIARLHQDADAARGALNRMSENTFL